MAALAWLLLLLPASLAGSDPSSLAPPLSSLHITVSDASRDFCSTELPLLQDLLTAASLSLHRTTGLALHTVSIQLPPTPALSCATMQDSPSPVSTGPSVTLAALPLLPGPRPLHPGGCGEPGLLVHLPRHWVAASANLTEERGPQLAAALTQATFGTFPTHGSQGSQRFPETFTVAGERRSSCDDGDFDSEAPTPHSLLCGERSPVEVVAAAVGPHQMAPGPPAPPVFSVWAPASSSTLYILLLDRSSRMETGRRWRNLHNALALFLADLPDGDRVAVITFDRAAHTRLAPVKLTASNRAGVHGRIPGKPSGEKRACLQCALRQAAKLAEGAAGRTQAILVTAASDAPVRKHHPSMPPLAVLLLGGPAGNPFAEEPAVRVYSVPETRGNTNEDIYDLLALIRGTEEHQPIKFFSSQLQAKSNSSAEGKFTVEEGLRTRMTVTATSTLTEDIEEFTLTSPSGHLFQFPVVRHGGVTFHFPGQRVEEGIWSWRVKMMPTTLEPTVPVRVAAYAEISATGPHLEGWWGEEREGEGARRIFARLTDASMPVTGASVIATVELPDGTTIEVELVDDGADNPDVLEGDGIYSGHFFQWADAGGWYSLRLRAEGGAGAVSAHLEGWGRTEVCGAALPRTKLVPTGPFTRHAAAASLHSTSGAVYVIRRGVPARKDEYPPSRVTDLRVEGTTGNLSLVWSAPGGDLGLGRAEAYSVRWAEDRRQLADRFTGAGQEVQEEVGEPGSAGELESLDLVAPKTNTVLYYAVVATDSEGNAGRVSNIVSVFVPEVFEEETALPSLQAAPSSLPLPPLTANLWIFVLSGSLGGVGLVVLLSVICFLRRARSKQLREKQPALPYLSEEAPYYLATPEPREAKLPALPPVSWTFQHAEAQYPTSSSSYSSSAASDTSSDRDLKASEGSGALDRDSVTRHSNRFSVEVESVGSPQSRLSVERDSLRQAVSSPHGRQHSDCQGQLGQQQKMKRRESFV